MSDLTPLPGIGEKEILKAFKILIENFVPSAEINDDSFTTENIREILSDHIGMVESSQIHRLMTQAGFSSKFSYARKELVWMMELKS